MMVITIDCAHDICIVFFTLFFYYFNHLFNFFHDPFCITYLKFYLFPVIAFIVFYVLYFCPFFFCILCIVRVRHMDFVLNKHYQTDMGSNTLKCIEMQILLMDLNTNSFK